MTWIYVTAIGICALGILAGLGYWMYRRGRIVSVDRALARLKESRASVQTAFFIAAAASGKPRGLTWKACDFGEATVLARDRRTRYLLAFVPVTISFEAVPGSDMEGLAAVGNLRCATAVFRFDGRAWITDGRALFNMDPEEALHHFDGKYERLAALET